MSKISSTTKPLCYTLNNGDSASLQKLKQYNSNEKIYPKDCTNDTN